MKKTLLTLISLFLLLSCSSAKKVSSTTTVKEKEVAQDINNNKTKDRVEYDTITIYEEINNEETDSVELVPRFNVIVEKDKIDHSVFNKLLQENVSEKGNVNYKGFITNKVQFKSYLETLANNLPKEDWTHEDKLAYWMNVYNAYTIKLIMDNYPTKSIKDIKDAWEARFFKLGTKWYNLNDVEHKILRKMRDPRIHFGINCASYSCPPLLNKAFTAANVDEELEKLASDFINDPTRNKISSDRIQLSKIFQWFGKDFKTQGSLIDYLNKYSKTPINSNAKKSYLKYDWNLNE